MRQILTIGDVRFREEDDKFTDKDGNIVPEDLVNELARQDRENPSRRIYPKGF